MNAQDLILGARVAHVRELKADVARLKAENAALRDELEALKAHFDAALLASADLRDLPADGRLEIWDGWNLILGAQKSAHGRDELIASAEAKVASSPTPLKVWIVFDGPREAVTARRGVRVSYTGGAGAHRADRFIVDFVRMAAYLGLSDRVSVVTHDRDFLAQLKKRQVERTGR